MTSCHYQPFERHFSQSQVKRHRPSVQVVGEAAKCLQLRFLHDIRRINTAAQRGVKSQIHDPSQHASITSKQLIKRPIVMINPRQKADRFFRIRSNFHNGHPYFTRQLSPNVTPLPYCHWTRPLVYTPMIFRDCHSTALGKWISSRGNVRAKLVSPVTGLHKKQVIHRGAVHFGGIASL